MRKLFAIVIVLVTSMVVTAQNLSNKGKEFWVGYGHHQFMETGTNTQEMVLYFSAEQPANVTVTINGTAYVRNYSVPANTVIASELIPKNGTNDARLFTPPCSFAPPGYACGGVGIFNKGINIKSDVPIVAYAHIYGSTSSGASMLMPVETWGYSYVSINSKQNYAANCFSWVYVIAKEDNTVIEVTPSVLTRNKMPANTPYTVTLMKGQVYQTMAGPETGSTKPEMTGTKIKSIANAAGDCFPVAVFSGSSRTSNPATCGSGGGDNDNQQLFPMEAWGKRYLTAPTSSSTNPAVAMDNMYKIIVKDPATVVKKNGTVLTGLIAGSYYYYVSSTADYIESDKPVMMAQFMSGGGCLNGGFGDPEMIIISPVEQGIKRIGFYRNDEESISTNYLTLIVPTGGVPSLRIDGSASFSHSYPHPQLSGYTVVVKRWGASKSQSIAFSDSAFTAVTYGLGSVESYGYNAGTLINNLSAISSIRNTPDTSAAVEHKFTCTTTPIELSALIAYQPTRLEWLLSELGNSVAPNANVVDNAPTPTGTVTVNGILYYKYTLPGTYSFNTADTFEIPLLSTHPSIENCYKTERLFIEVVVKEKPVANFNITHSGCTVDTAYFSADATTPNGFPINQWKWELSTGIKEGKNIQQVFAPGDHNIKLTVISPDGCISDTTKTFTVIDKPTAGFIYTPLTACEGSTISFTDTSNYGATNPVNSWYWDFGNGNVVNNNTSPAQDNVYAGAGTYTVKHVSKSSSTCISDTVSHVITINAAPKPLFTYPSGVCLEDGKVQFTNSSTIADGQSLSYLWNFDDPTADAGNPNTSTDKDPTHTYNNYGTFNINLSVTSQNGCTADTTITATFSIQPKMIYTPLSAICENAGAISVANASITNGVPGTGVYKGSGTDASGNFNPVNAGPGTHKIWYVFTSTGGCADSVSADITVYAKPKPAFTYPVGCLPLDGVVQFNNTTTVSDGQAIATYNWDFGDSYATGSNPNTSTLEDPTHIYTNYGTYNIKLSTTTENGCTADTTVSATLNIAPQLAFTSLSAICENAGSLSVANGSVTNGVTGTAVYKGAGTHASGSFNPLAAGPGTHTIWYVFTSSGGCADSLSQDIVVHAAPKPSFTYPTGGCLENGSVQFTNTTTIADAQSLSYLWNFDDPASNPGNPNTSTDKDPLHIYSSFGTYDVSLSVTSEKGCTADTTVNATFSIQPKIAYGALTSICENEDPKSIAGGSVTNAVPGSGIYKGAGTDASGNFNPSIAGSGIHTIWYVFTSSTGCMDSASSTIEVYPKPVAKFLLDNSICLNETTTITDESSISSGNITTWNWNFGNATTASYTNSNPFVHSYTTHGNYTIKLAAISDKSCVSDTFSTTISVNPLPVPKFSLPVSICMPNGSGTFNNLTTIAGNSGLNYVWDFGDGSATSTATNPVHTFNAAGTYNITLTATSAMGCVKDTVMVFDAFYDKPIANFNVSPDTLCQGVSNEFTDFSTAPNSTVQNWKWIFGDGKVSTESNPDKTFTSPGNYNVKLIVTNAVGCISDTLSKPVIVYLQPVIDAGPSFVVPEGTLIRFNPTANDSSVLKFLWTPSGDFTDATVLRPQLVATYNQNYTLTATGEGNCSATDTMSVKILKVVTVPNAFSPNGDGINDTWNIRNLIDYPGATVEVFNRYGQQVYYSSGYTGPWNGTFKGSPLPVATYYYVITLKNGFVPITGSVTIIK